MTIKDAADSGTRVTTRSRKSLRSLRLEGTDAYWDDLDQGVAAESRLRPKDRGRRPVVIPLDPTIRSRARELAEMLPSLLDDLGA